MAAFAFLFSCHPERLMIRATGPRLCHPEEATLCIADEGPAVASLALAGGLTMPISIAVLFLSAFAQLTPIDEPFTAPTLPPTFRVSLGTHTSFARIEPRDPATPHSTLDETILPWR